MYFLKNVPRMSLTVRPVKVIVASCLPPRGSRPSWGGGACGSVWNSERFGFGRRELDPAGGGRGGGRRRGAVTPSGVGRVDGVGKGRDTGDMRAD